MICGFIITAKSDQYITHRTITQTTTIVYTQERHVTLQTTGTQLLSTSPSLVFMSHRYMP